MTKTNKKLVLLVIFPFLFGMLTSCWDRKELDTLVIITGFCVDKGEEGSVKVTLQAGEVVESSGGGGGGGEQGENGSFYMLSKQANTLHSGIRAIMRESTGELFLSHNQIIIFSEDAASEGLERHIDYFLRGRENRLEQYLLISEGSAEEVLKNEVQKGEIPSVTLANMLTLKKETNESYGMNLLGYLDSIMDEAKCPVIPMIKAEEENEKTQFVFGGMGVIKEGKLIGKLDDDQTIGYQWITGTMDNADMEIITADGSVAVHVSKQDCKTNVVLKDGDKVEVYLDIKANLVIGEIIGFKDAELDDIDKILKETIPAKITEYIQSCFNKAADLRADIFGFGHMLFRKNSTKWRLVKDKWDEIFPEIKIYITIDVKLTDTGATGKTPDMIKQ